MIVHNALLPRYNSQHCCSAAPLRVASVNDQPIGSLPCPKIAAIMGLSLRNRTLCTFRHAHIRHFHGMRIFPLIVVLPLRKLQVFLFATGDYVFKGKLYICIVKAETRTGTTPSTTVSTLILCKLFASRPLDESQMGSVFLHDTECSTA